LLTAELVKLTENTYRDVQIAFANEIAMLCDDLGLDVWQVRDLVNKVPLRQMHRPGGGVGGHCLPKDPWLLAAAATSAPLRVIRAARTVNDGMPVHIAHRLTSHIRQWEAVNGSSRPSSIAILGYSYLPDSDDIRNTPSEALISELRGAGFEVRIHDPYVAKYTSPLEDVLSGCVAVVVMVAHRTYDRLPLDNPIVLRVGRRQ
jgi:UDP-N-acetyl-D-mannosaminuronic acid dehydrogenase